ncbi:MAG: tetratricopeptide repeat protein [Bradymonadales bacterium]|nr:tetratricopeptide repeat protein [Bradymonadales bacterium]
MAFSLGPFELEDILGVGGMGEVWQGVHRPQGIRVAVKVITRAHAREVQFIQGFRREVQAVARLDHPGIVMVLDHGEITQATERSSGGKLTAGSPYLVMEYCGRGSLEKLDLPLPWRSLRSILLSILDALAHAHARGVIHRDLKPANVLLAGEEGVEPQCKLTDFGIAHALEDQDSSSSEEAPSGTPLYMAPEQFSGQWRDHGPWTDLYALGCLAHQLATGTVPFERTNFLQLAAAHLAEPPPPISDSPHLPSGYASWVLRLLQKEPEARFGRAADAAQALRSLGEPAGGQWSERPSGVERPSVRQVGTIEEAEGELAVTVVEPTLSVLPSRSLPSDVAARPEAEAVGKVTPFPVMRTLLPETWRSAATAPQSIQLVGAGLGLYGLRSIPLVDRDRERDCIWSDLLEVHQQSEARLVLLHGAAGQGKSRLAEWMCERAHEVGAASVMRAVHGAIAGPADGVGPMIARTLRCLGQSRDKLLGRLERLLRRQGVADEYEWHALAELIQPATDEEIAGGLPQVRFGGPETRHALVCRLLSRLAAHRPLIIWLDDVQWGSEAISLARYVMANRRVLPVGVLLLLTAREEALACRPIEARQIAELMTVSGTRDLAVKALDRSHQAELVRRLLLLEGKLAEQVEERSGGNPLFAVQLIGDWVQRGVLTVGQRGFVLKAGERAVLPDDIHRLWLGRIQAIGRDYAEFCARSPVLRSPRTDPQTTLELAATLGQIVDLAEWYEVCGQVYLDPPLGLQEMLLAVGLAVPSESGWTFAHGMLRESLERLARESGRWSWHNRACATMLATRYPQRPPGISERLGRHLVEAGDLEEALEPLLMGAFERKSQADFGGAMQVLDQREAVLDRLGAPGTDLRRARGWLTRAQVLAKQNEFAGAITWAERSAGVARQEQEGEMLAESLRILGMSLRNQGKVQLGLDHLEESLRLFRSLGERKGLAMAMLTLAYTHFMTGANDQAWSLATEACQLSHHGGDLDTWLNSLRVLAAIALQRGDPARAMAFNRQALDHYQRLGYRHDMATCFNAIGEIQRLTGDLVAAEESYRQALSLNLSLGDISNRLIVQLNFSYIRLARGEYFEALPGLRQLVAEFERRGALGHVGIALCPLLACMAGVRDWKGWEQRVSRAEALFQKTQMADADAARSLVLAGDLAHQAGEPDRARQVYQLALAIWQKIGDQAQVAWTRARLDQIPG